LKGFSLIEVMMALGITLGIGLIVFQLFRQNERVFRDQNLVIEMQQTARAVASQIADEVRMAGEGVPVYASRFDSLAQEGAAVVLASSTNNRIDFRAGLSLVETSVTTPVPLDCTLGLSRTLTVADGSSFLNALGTTTPSGKFVYIWGPANNQMWTWVRAELTRINGNTLTLTPRQGRVSSVFTRAPTLTLEEAVSFYLSGTNVRRATAADMTNLASPAWSASNDIGRNVTSLTFTYYDENNTPIDPGSLTKRFSIMRVDVRLVAQTSDALSDGSRPSHTLSFRTIPRNLRVRLN
jgi:Tfp pilus assembly protein PilW